MLAGSRATSPGGSCPLPEMELYWVGIWVAFCVQSLYTQHTPSICTNFCWFVKLKPQAGANTSLNESLPDHTIVRKDGVHKYSFLLCQTNIKTNKRTSSGKRLPAKSVYNLSTFHSYFFSFFFGWCYFNCSLFSFCFVCSALFEIQCSASRRRFLSLDRKNSPRVP